MAEEEEKKKAGIVKRVFKWLGLAVLTILLIGAIIFQAPWKVLTLLVIIFAACTILPKPYRKWFWLSVAGVVVALVIWVFLPEETEGWRRYTFDEELAVMEAKYAVADEENAAKIYEQLLEAEKQEPNEPNVPDDYYLIVQSEPWSSEDYPEIAQWIQEQQDKIETLLKAAKIENCHFPINADPISLDYTLNRLSPMRQRAHLLIYAGNNDLGEGRINQAIEKNLAVLKMAKHQCQQAAIIDMLVGIAIEALALGQLNQFVVTGDATEEELNIIEEALTEIKHDWSYDLPKFLEYDKLMQKNLLGMFYGVNTEGEIRLTHGLARAMMSQLPEDMKDEFALMYWRKKLMKVTAILFWLYIPTKPQKLGEVIDEHYERYYAMAEPGYDWQKEPEQPSSTFKLNYRYMIERLSGMLEESYYRIHDLYLRHNSNKRCGQIIVGLRRYKNKEGRWPGSLEEIESLVPAETLVDPINNNSFVYKLTEENFTLYSKGENNIDEDGEYNYIYDPNGREGTVEEDDRLIWPTRREGEAEEEDEDDE